jgi:tetratricopeptide (TPR) repeat protein
MAFQNNPNYHNTYDAYITYNDLGNIYYAKNNKPSLDSALMYYKLSIAIEPRMVHLRYYNCGNIYNLNNMPDSALAYYKKAIEIKPNFTGAYYNAGNAYFYLGSDYYDSAIAMYKHTIEIDPNYVKAYNSLAFVFTKTRQYESAISNYKKALALKPDDAVNYFRLALVYLMNKNNSDALINLEAAFQKGYKDVQMIRAEPNLNPIRGDEKFKDLIKKYFPNY